MKPPDGRASDRDGPKKPLSNPIAKLDNEILDDLLRRTELAINAYFSGLRMSNAIFNICQHTDPPTETQWNVWCKVLLDTQNEWDRFSTELHNLIKQVHRLIGR